jgi:hypothetical protein
LHTGGIVEIEPEFSEILLSDKSIVDEPQLNWIPFDDNVMLAPPAFSVIRSFSEIMELPPELHEIRLSAIEISAFLHFIFALSPYTYIYASSVFNSKPFLNVAASFPSLSPFTSALLFKEMSFLFSGVEYLL